jgi:Tfp pilus assembly protein PilO
VTGQDRRELFAHGLIGVALCIGAYFMFIDSPRKKLADAQAEAEGLETQVRTAESLMGQVPALSKALERVDREVLAIRDMGRPAREQRGLYAAITSLAASNGVRLDELNPVAVSATLGQDQHAAQGPKPADVTIAYNMVGIGTYEQAAAFIAALRTQLGYSVVRSVRIVPVQDEHVRLVRAIIDTEHYSFDPSPVQAADAGGH